MSRRPVPPRIHAAVALAPLALLVAGPTPAQQPFPADEDLAVMLHYLVEDGAAPGIVFGIVEADGASRVVAAGRAGAGASPVGSRTLFELGSITKAFTGILLAEMVGRGEVSLEDPVSRFLPSSVRVPSRGGREITLLDLATHRSGLPAMPPGYLPPDLADPFGGFTVEDLHVFLSGYELPRDPGAESEYSNVGFGLLGHALALAAGRPFRDLLRERVVAPLGLEATGYVVAGDRRERMASGHRHGRVVRAWSTTAALDGAGGLISSMEDMLRFLAANLDPPETDLGRALRDAHRPLRPFIGDEEIGLAWRIGTQEGGTIVRHGGISGGHSTVMAFDPGAGVGFVRLANARDFPTNLGLFFLQSGPPLDLPEVAVPAAVLARYAGSYELSPGSYFHIRLEEDGTLTAQAGNTERFRLYADSDSTFFVKRLPRRLGFRTDATGAVTAMVIGARALPRVSDDTPPPGMSLPRVLDLPLSPGDIARYEGTYSVELGGRSAEARVRGEDGQLVARIVGGPATRLLHQGDHRFVLAADTDGRLEFQVERDRARGFVLRLGGAVIEGRRIR